MLWSQEQHKYKFTIATSSTKIYDLVANKKKEKKRLLHLFYFIKKTSKTQESKKRIFFKKCLRKPI